jgi:hypothetical protein
MRARQIANQQELDAQAFQIEQLRDQRAQERQLKLDTAAAEQQATANEMAQQRIDISQGNLDVSEARLDQDAKSAQELSKNRAFTRLSGQAKSAGSRVESLAARLEEARGQEEDLKISLSRNIHDAALKAAGVSGADALRGMSTEQLAAVNAFKDKEILKNPEYARHLQGIQKMETELQQAQQAQDALDQRVLDFGTPPPAQGPTVQIPTQETAAQQGMVTARELQADPVKNAAVANATRILPSMDVNTPQGAADIIFTVSSAMEDYAIQSNTLPRWERVEGMIVEQTKARMAKAKTQEEKEAIQREAAIAMRDVLSEVTGRVTAPLQPVGSNNARSP